MAYNYEYPSVNMNDYNNDWLINKVKELANEWANVEHEWTTQQEAFNNLKSWIENYFKELDVSKEISDKLDSMVESGEFDAILATYLNPYIQSQNEKIDNLTNRVNAITSLPEGSTTGDAELTDIRVPAQVLQTSTYDNAGNSVRGQVSQLYYAISNIYEGLLKDGSIGLNALGNITDNQRIITYNVTADSTKYDYFGIVGYITPPNPVSYIDIDFIIKSDTKIDNVYVSVLDVNGEKLEGGLFKFRYKKRILFESPKNSAGAVNIFVKHSTPFSFEISEIRLLDSNNHSYYPTFIVNTAFGTGTLHSSVNEFPALATQDYVNSVVDSGSYALKKWGIIGDSLSSYNTLGVDSPIYISFIETMCGIKTQNLAIGGTGYWKGSGTNESFFHEANNLDTDCDIVTIFGSFNDLGTENGVSGASIIGSVTDTDTSTIAGCVNTTLDNIYETCPNAVVGIITPTPWSNSRETSSQTYVDMLKKIGARRNIPVLDLYTRSNLSPWDISFRSVYYKSQEDGVHPNSKGHLRFAGMVLSFIKELLLPISI